MYNYIPGEEALAVATFCSGGDVSDVVKPVKQNKIIMNTTAMVPNPRYCEIYGNDILYRLVVIKMIVIIINSGTQ